MAIRKEQVLVLQKVGYSKKYSLPGGITKKKEGHEQGLIREVLEEIGQQLNTGDLTYFISRKDRKKKEQKVYKHYFITTRSLKRARVCEPHKFKKVLWVPWYEALEDLDREDRSAVALYFDQNQKIAN